jgi:hypothetical protein
MNKKQAKQAAAAAKKQKKQIDAAAKKQARVETKILKKELSVKKVGAVLDVDEFNNLKTKLGSDVRIADFAAARGIKLDPAITNPPAPKENKEGDPANIPGFASSTAEGYSPAVFDYQKGLDYINAQGNINTNIQRIESEANKYVSELETGATRYTADQQLAAEKERAQATRYVADRELESNLGVENIRSKGAIDLQGIINAGASNVETIRGEYAVKGKKIDRNTTILGGLVSAFNF